MPFCISLTPPLIRQRETQVLVVAVVLYAMTRKDDDLARFLRVSHNRRAAFSLDSDLLQLDTPSTYTRRLLQH